MLFYGTVSDTEFSVRIVKVASLAAAGDSRFPGRKPTDPYFLLASSECFTPRKFLVSISAYNSCSKINVAFNKS